MLFSSSFSNTPRNARRGIALLVTIILLVFLVLIVVALSALVRVETQIAVNTDYVAQARQNALYAANLALGRLQETAGPDRRVTARSDIVGNNPHNSYLTGVWDENGRIITWLVNGNEDHLPGSPAVEPDATTTSRTSQAARILDPTNDTAAQNPITRPIFDDSEPPALNLTTGSSPKFADGHVYLASGRIDSSNLNLGSVDVRANTLSGSTNKNRYKDAVGERIILRKSPILVKGASIPGKSPNADVVVGNYAFWVADDGIRASIGSGDLTQNVDHDDSGATPPGMDYRPAANNVSDEAYVARQYLRSLQLPRVRADLVLRPDNMATDLFSTNVNRIGFYGMLAHPANNSFFASLTSIDQLTQLPGLRSYTAATPSVAGTPAAIDTYQRDIRDRLRQRFHDITPRSLGVLTNMIAGGLRRDLTFEVDNNFPNTPAGYQSGIAAFMTAWRSNGVVSPLATGSPSGLLASAATILPPPKTAFDSNAPTDAAYFPLVPVISEFEFRMDTNLKATNPVVPGQANLAVEFTSAMELWNPYNVELIVPSGQNLYVTIPILRGPGDPYLRDFVVTVDGTSHTVSVERTIAQENAANANGETYLVFQIGTTGSEKWEPGEVKVWKFTGLAENPARRPDGSLISDIPAPSGVTSITQDNDSLLSVTLHMGNASNLADPVLFEQQTTPLYRVAGLNYASVGTVDTDGTMFHFRLNDHVDYDADNNKVWLGVSNPVGPVLRPDGAAPVFTVSPTLPLLADMSAFDSDPQLLTNADKGTAARVVLFDVPRQEVVSIGALQHLAFSQSSGANTAKAYRIGSAAAAGANVIFDTHFISTVPRDPTPPLTAPWSPVAGQPLPNTALRVFDPTLTQDATAAKLLRDATGGPGGVPTGLQTARAAEYLLIDGAFNINSTSVAAWMGLLGGTLPGMANPTSGGVTGQDFVWDTTITDEILGNWRYRAGGGNDQVFALSNAHFRLPNTATYLEQDYASVRDDLGASDDGTRFAASFLLGVRSFSKLQIQTLARNVVNRIKANGAPFRSVAAFVESGLLQAAIDESGFNNDLPALSTAYLSQGDILQAIAPRLVARSDTFTIRAYGEVTDSVVAGSEVPAVRARAWVEMTVQRTPVKHRTADDPDDNMTPTLETVGNFGRQFRVVGLRWLSPDEI